MRTRLPLLFAGLVAFGAACGPSPDSGGGPSAGTGGVPSGTGGSAAGSGGRPGGSGSGGVVGSGGAASGGASTGGASTGGRGENTGGANSGGRGMTGTGGSGTGGRDSAGSGGTASGGRGGGTSTGGTSGAAGSSGGGGESAGCGLATFPAECNTTGSPCSLMVGSMARTYYVILPTGYSSAKKYPLIFLFHPLGGNAEQARTMYRIREGIPDAIYVAPQGLGSTAGWPNTGGQDVNFTKAMLEKLRASYCVDNARIFSTGFSYGGMMSITLGCQMSEVFRAIGVESGFATAACNPTHPIAVWQTQGSTDGTVKPADAAAARDAFVKVNHCKTTTMATTPSPCVSYDGCDTGYPVVWCLNEGQGHAIPSYGSSAITAFFKQF